MKKASVSLLVLASLAVVSFADEQRVAVKFSGGHDLDPRDHGRPVVLIANALGVKPEIFREAFSHVNPARNGAPEPGRVHDNKRALLDALGKYGITNDRLDSVSDFYRYRPGADELWRNVNAEAYAIVANGKVTKLVITNPGYGYTTKPTATVDGKRLETEIAFDKDVKKNGRVVRVK